MKAQLVGALLIDPCNRDGRRVWQHQAPDGVPALHPGGSHRGRECALRQEQRLLQPVRGLSLHTIYVYVENYTDVKTAIVKVLLIKPFIHSMHAFILKGVHQNTMLSNGELSPKCAMAILLGT